MRSYLTSLLALTILASPAAYAQEKPADKPDAAKEADSKAAPVKQEKRIITRSLQ